MAVEYGKYMTVDSSYPAVPVLQSAIDTSAGAGDAGKIIKLNASGQIDSTMLGSASAAVASEAIQAGDLVYIYNDSGTGKLALADASAANGAKRAMYMATSAGNIGDSVSYVPTGSVTRTSHGYGAPGTQLYLSGATPGDCTATAPTTATYLVQAVAVVRDENTLDFNLGVMYTV